MPVFKKKLLKNKATIIFTSFAAVVIAISFFNLAIILAPDQPRYVYAYQQESQDHRLVEYWTGILEENPDYLPGWLELAKLKIQNEEWSDAFLAASQALRIDPNSELVKNTLAQIDSQELSK